MNKYFELEKLATLNRYKDILSFFALFPFSFFLLTTPHAFHFSKSLHIQTPFQLLTTFPTYLLSLLLPWVLMISLFCFGCSLSPPHPGTWSWYLLFMSLLANLRYLCRKNILNLSCLSISKHHWRIKNSQLSFLFSYRRESEYF